MPAGTTPCTASGQARCRLSGPGSDHTCRQLLYHALGLKRCFLAAGLGFEFWGLGFRTRVLTLDLWTQGRSGSNTMAVHEVPSLQGTSVTDGLWD